MVDTWCGAVDALFYDGPEPYLEPGSLSEERDVSDMIPREVLRSSPREFREYVGSLGLSAEEARQASKLRRRALSCVYADRGREQKRKAHQKALGKVASLEEQVKRLEEQVERLKDENARLLAGLP